MGQLRTPLAASFFICCLLTAIAAAQDQTLQIGTPIERKLAGGQSHTFSITVEQNMFVQVVVEQRGIDVVVKVSNPDGKSLGTTDTPNGDKGPENVSFVATAAGAYRIIVTPLNQNAREGEYQIKVIESREATEQELKSGKNMEGIKEKGLALLAEAERLTQEIRTPQTRIRSQLQAAQMLWELDEKRASNFLNDVAAGFMELVATLDVKDPNYAMDHNGITQLRHEILQIMAARDPDAAISFLAASKLPGDPYGNRRAHDQQETALELMIAEQIMAKDPRRAFEMARKKLKSGYSMSLLNTIATMRHKNSELATELANEIAGKLLQERLLKNPEAVALSVGMLFSCRSRDKVARSFERGGNVFTDRLMSEELCRNLMQKAFQEALSFSPQSPTTYTPDQEAAWGLLNGLQQLGPELNEAVHGGLAAIEKKLGELTAGARHFSATTSFIQPLGNSIGTSLNGPVEEAVANIEKAPEDVREHLYIQLANLAAARGDSAGARKIINENISNPYQRNHALANLEQQEMYRSMSQGRVEDALRAISALRTPRERAQMLGQIARQIGPGYTRAAALNLLEQARNLVAPGFQAQDQEQMNALLELARAFSRYDTKRAFDLVEPLIDQFNELCTAARTLHGFGPEFYKNEELDMLNGNSLSGLSMNLSSALGTLALTNFERAKTASDRLRLPEVRLRAYLEIAQQAIEAAK